MPETGHRTSRSIAVEHADPAGQDMPEDRGAIVGKPGNIDGDDHVSTPTNTSFDARLAKNEPVLKNKPSGDPDPTPAAATMGSHDNHVGF